MLERNKIQNTDQSSMLAIKKNAFFSMVGIYDCLETSLILLIAMTRQ